MIRRIVLSLFLLCFFHVAFAQDYQKITARIDSFAKAFLPKSALAEVDKLDAKAHAEKNAPMQIRAALYRMTFQSQTEENAIVAIINRLKQDIQRAEYPAKPVLQSLLASMYWQYYQRNFWQFSQRTKLEKPGDDFTKWDLQTIFAEISRNYELSLSDWQREQAAPIEQIDPVLTGSKDTRYLRPTLYDLLAQQALDFYLSDQAALNKPKDPFTLTDPKLFGSSQAFVGLKLTTTDTAAIGYKGVRYLQQASLFHLKGDYEEALADIDLKRLEFLYRHAVLDDKDSLYLNAVREVAKRFSTKPISAEAWALCGKYFLDKNDCKSAYAYFKKAVGLYPESTGGKNAAQKLIEIQQKQLSVTFEEVNMPDKPSLALINYRNVKVARVHVYRLSIEQYTQMTRIPSDINRYNYGLNILASDSAFKYLAKFKPIINETLNLPGTDDYNRHNAEFKIDALPSGHYVIAVRDEQSDDKGTVQLAGFKLCKLSFVTRVIDREHVEIQVVNRATGQPVPNVLVTADETQNSISDKRGKCVFNISSSRFGQYAVKLTTATDTLYTQTNTYGGLGDQTSTSTILFTDRGMYRPGQTVYFKGLHLERTEGKNSILPGTSLTVTIKDNNNKQLTIIPVTTNDYGTFAGSYTLPASILNGGVSISTSNGTAYVRVEEYKRPTFQVNILPIGESYKPNDSVHVKGKVTAFSGYGISQARVAYRITRNIVYSPYNWYLQRSLGYTGGNTELVTDTIKTDDQGNFEIRFKATTNPQAELKKLTYQYYINVDVTDASGETRSVNSSVKVGVNNINIVSSGVIQTADSIRFTGYITNLNNSMIKGTMKAKVYALWAPGQVFKARFWNKPDQHILTPDQFNKDFPDYAYDKEDDQNYWPLKAMVAELNRPTDKQKVYFNLDMLKKQPSGSYKIVIDAKNEQGDTVSTIQYFYLMNEPAKPEKMNDWIRPVNIQASPEKPAEFLLGTGKQSQILMEKFVDMKRVSSEWLNIPAGNQRLIKVPVETGQKGISVHFLMVAENRSYTSQQRIYNQNENDMLDIRLMTFRDILQPGEKEQWKLQVSAKNNEKLSAELLASLYDASLDDLGQRSYWNTNVNVYWNMGANWNLFPNNAETTNPLRYTEVSYGWSVPLYEHLNLFGYNYYGGYNSAYHSFLRDKTVFAKSDSVEYKAEAYAVERRTDLMGAVSSLNEVVVNEPVRNAAITIRGASTLKGKDFAAAETNLPADILKNVQVIDDYGDQGVNTANIVTRKNFAETAFFYPQLHTDEHGEVLIDFTIPESLTRWKFRAFAHTRGLQTGYIEKEIITQKKLSITANMPRFLREGDTVTVSARLANLVSSALKGKVALQLFNGMNMQPVHLLANPADAQQNFDIASATTKSVKFKLIVPAGLDALTYKITAGAGEFTDGEENTIPVLPNRMLVTESMPMMIRPGQSRSYNFEKLTTQHSSTLKSKTLTLEYTQNPTWYAVQALPYMMEFPYECSEQIFSRYYANSLGTSMVNKLPVIKQVFDQWKTANSAELLSNLEKNQELKATLIDETPWLQDAINETEQKKRIALLFDLNKMNYELQQNLDKLQKRQLTNGGFPWFGGDRADRYITSHILEGIGQLYHLNIADTKNQQLKDVADKAMQYVNGELIDDANFEKKNNTYESRIVSSTEIYSYYTQSYYPGMVLTTELKALRDNYLHHAETQWKLMGIYEEGMIALTMLRDGKPDVTKAIMRSLLETAQRSDDMGMYWAKNRLGWFWYQSPVETQCLLIELFTEAGNHDNEVEGMKIWLLRNKQTNNWKTTKATAAACYALLLKGGDWLADEGKSQIKLGGNDLAALKPDVKASSGTGYIKTTWVDDQVKPELGKVDIKNNSKTISWGAVYWQYLENLDKITPSTAEITLDRKYFILKHTATGDALAAVDASHQPKTGDLLKVVVYLKAGRDYEYVQLKDMRPAGTEPVDVLSTYKLQDGLYYYQVTKDVATNFFIDRLNKGNYVFEYRLRVAQPGNFSTGITSVQSMYAPEFNAHSEGTRMIVK